MPLQGFREDVVQELRVALLQFTIWAGLVEGRAVVGLAQLGPGIMWAVLVSLLVRVELQLFTMAAPLRLT